MLLNLFRISLRSLRRDRFYTVLNGLGLAVGLAAALLIFLWAHDELTFDDFHPQGDRIHRVLASWTKQENLPTLAMTPMPFAEAVREQVPEVEQICRLWNVQDAVLSHSDKKFGVEGFYLADREFFTLFNFPFLHGDAETAFDQPSNIVLTARLAELIFGTTDVIGQPLVGNGVFPLTVSGVLTDAPSNSHLRFEALLPFRANAGTIIGEWANTWTSFNFDTYVLLRPGVEVATVAKKLSATFPPKEDFQRENATFTLQPLRDVYLHSDHVQYSSAPQGNLSNIQLVGLVGLLILLIACINYVNLSTARSAHRAKAVGVRKIVGASRAALFGQFLTEAAVLIGLASILAVAIANMSLGWLEEITGKHLTVSQLMTPATGWIMLGTALLAILMAGIQPALQLSRFRPLETLRGSGLTDSPDQNSLRKILVTSQFACSGALIIGTFVMLAQMDFVKKEKLGYDREHIFSFTIDEADPPQVIEALRRQPGVLAATASNHLITNIASQYRGFDFEGKTPNSDPIIRLINPEGDFREVFGLELVAGRWFRPGNEANDGYLLNEAAVKSFGWEGPPVGKWVVFNDRRAPVIGVVKNFHYRSLHHEIEPLIFAQDPAWLRQVYVKTTGENAAQAIASARQVYDQFEPAGLFIHHFLDESYERLYESETRSGRLFSFFAALAIFISCLGILGLATYSAERRAKEIGIRKILGASLTGIVGLLSKDFLKPVLIAMLIASPIAWYFMQDWLQNFAYHIELGWWIFVLAGAVVLVIALLTVSFQSVRAAVANPVESLRSE